MNGDFLSLLPKSPLSQMAGVGKHESFQDLHATTVFAFHCAEGVLMAGDHRATAGNTIFSDQTEKILELDGHSMMAIAGSPAMAFEMARTLQTTYQFYRRSQLQPMSLAAKIRALSKLLRENMPATIQGIGIVAPIFVGLETEDPTAKPAIHFYDPLGAQFEAASHASSGSGSGTIRSVLHYLEKWGNPRPQDLNLAQAVTLANRLLMTAAEFDSATGGVHPHRRLFATAKLLTRDGIRNISLEDHVKYWEEAEA